MAETRRFGAPLLEAGQAQKHVTVNEALTRLDALAAGAAVSRRLTAPPAAPVDGDVYLPAPGASGAWAGRAGSVAVFDNGGWIFAAPTPGRRIWVQDEEAEVVCEGGLWVVRDAGRRLGASTRLETIVFDHALGVGATSETVAAIPLKSVVFGVTARVIEALTGPGLTTWRLGVPSGSGRYGWGYGAPAGSMAHGMTGQPQTYYAPTPLLIEAMAGSFTGGRIRFAVHALLVEPPGAP
jgi:hypothetical protein